MKRDNIDSENKVRSWLMSFNDLLTLILVFLILLVSISNVSADKVQHAASSAAMVFGADGSKDRREEIMRRIASVQGVDRKSVV